MTKRDARRLVNEGREVVVSTTLYRAMESRVEALMRFVQRVAEESTQPELIAAARELGADV